MADDVKPAHPGRLNTIIDERATEPNPLLYYALRPRKGRGVRDLLHRLCPHPDVIEQMLKNVYRPATWQYPPDTGFLHAGDRRPYFVPTGDFLDDPPARGEMSSGSTLAAPATDCETGARDRKLKGATK